MLAIIELAEKSSFNLIDVLNLHLFLFFLNLDELEERVCTRSLSILLHVSLQHFLNVLLTELFGVQLGRYGVHIGELILEHLVEEDAGELDHDAV